MTKEIEPRVDDGGTLIKKHDVLVNVYTGEVVLVIDATNQAGVSGLAVENKYAGISDWLDVYPDRTFLIVGNADTSIG
jgi:hypothetical protein